MLKVEISDTPLKLEKGLMYVDHLPEDEGMLFVFPCPRKLSFWGRNTFIPLDIAFVDRNNVIEKISHIEPFDTSGVYSSGICEMAIEANRGYFKKHNINVGDKINIETDDWRRTANIKFNKSTVKESQAIADPTLPPSTPMNDQDESNLPVLGPDEIQKMLEDSFDEPQGEPEQEPLSTEPETPTEPQTPKEYPTFNNIFDALDWAEKNKEVMRINYITRSGRQLTRDVEPHGQFHASTTMHQISVVFDETIKDIRAFIITNIQNWSFLNKQFQKKFIVRA